MGYIGILVIKAKPNYHILRYMVDYFKLYSVAAGGEMLK